MVEMPREVDEVSNVTTKEPNKNDSECLELVEAATEFAESNQLELAADTFLEAAECFDKEGDRSRSARYLTAAAEFFEMLGEQRQSSRCYGKAILRHLLADEVENAIIVLQKAHLLGATNSMFNFLLAQKNFEKRGINVEDILERAEKDLAIDKIREIKSQMEQLTSKEHLEGQEPSPEIPMATPTRTEPLSAPVTSTIPELEQDIPEFELVPLPEIEDLDLYPLTELTPTHESPDLLKTQVSPAEMQIDAKRTFVTNLKSFEIHSKDDKLQSFLTSNQDLEFSLLPTIKFEEILELHPIEMEPNIKIDLQPSEQILPPDTSLTLSNEEASSKSTPSLPLSFSINQQIKALSSPSLTPLKEMTEVPLDEHHLPGMPSTEILSPDVSLETDATKVEDLDIPGLRMDIEPIRYVNIYEIIPETTTEDLTIPELVITTTVSSQWEILDMSMSGIAADAEVMNREMTNDGEIITWKIKEIKPKDRIKIQYTLRRRFQRIIYWRVGNKIHSASSYHAITTEESSKKWNVTIPFINTHSQTIHEVLIEDIPPPELLVEHVESSPDQNPKIIVKEGLTRFQWYRKHLEAGEKISITYFLSERPLSYHFIDDFIERFTGQRIRVEKLVEPRTVSKDLHYFILYRIICPADTISTLKIIDHYPAEFTLEKFKPEWEKLNFEEDKSQKRLEWIIRDDKKGGVRSLLVLVKGSQNYSPSAPSIEFQNKKVIESKEIERKITKKSIDLKSLFSSS